MSEDLDELVDNIKQGSTWLRIVLMVGFAVVLYVVGVVIIFLTLAQALFSLFTGSDNRNLRMLGASVSEYVSQVLLFITYNTEERPFPFAPFPDANEVSKAKPAPVKQKEKETETEQQAAHSKKSPVKKKASPGKKTSAGKVRNGKKAGDNDTDVADA